MHKDGLHIDGFAQAAVGGDVLALLKFDPGHPTRLVSRENSRLEYKESFNWGNRAKYARTMAGFANNAGGFIVFGVKDSPHEIVGLSSNRFERLDPAKVSEYLNSKFAPELEWESYRVEMAGCELGVIATRSAREKPVVCIGGDGKDLREADIYYRYRGRSERIRLAELQKIMKENRRRERDAFLKHLRKIARVGPENIGVLDLVRGELSGHQNSMLISEDLLSQVQFIREGRFAESEEDGLPTLHVIGNLEIVESDTLLPIKTVPTPKAIRPKELMLGFLRQERPQEPKEYLKQACRENSPNMPVYHFARLAKMSLDQLRAFILEETPNRTLLLRRLDGVLVNPVGSLDAETDACMERLEVLDILEEGKVDGAFEYGFVRAFEAISHFTPPAPPIALLNQLAEIAQNEFDGMSTTEQTAFRKAVARLDECLNRDHCV